MYVFQLYVYYYRSQIPCESVPDKNQIPRGQLAEDTHNSPTETSVFCWRIENASGQKQPVHEYT